MSAARSCLSTGLAASRPGVVERVLLFLRSLAAARPPSAVVEAFPDAGHEGGLLDVVRLGVGAQWGKARPRIQALQRFPAAAAVHRAGLAALGGLAAAGEALAQRAVVAGAAECVM